MPESCSERRASWLDAVPLGSNRMDHTPSGVELALLARSILVGVSGFEPPTSCSRSRRANQAALHPVVLEVMLPTAARTLVAVRRPVKLLSSVDFAVGNSRTLQVGRSDALYDPWESSIAWDG